jgi:hypothetical protein
MVLAFLIVFSALVSLHPAVADDARAPAEKLRSEIGSFRLTLSYEGEYEGPPRNLTLTTVPRLTDLNGNWIPQPLVRISRKQAERIIDQLEASGFLAGMKASIARGDSSSRTGVGRRYAVTLAVDPPGGSVRLRDDLGWGKDLQEWLGGLKSVLEGDASRQLGRLEEEHRLCLEREARARPSEPIVVNGIEFTAIGETTWIVPKVGAKTDVELSLRVTNRSPKTLRFNRFDTIRIELRDERGRQIPLDGGRDGTIFLDPLALRPGETQIIPRRGTLKWDQEGKILSVGGWDGTNAFWRFGGIRPGRYSLAFTCQNDRESTNRMEQHRRRGDTDEGPSSLGYWQGDVKSRALVIRVNDQTSR